MKILYGVQGTGNGHITRARAMAKAFAANPSMQVDYVFTGRERGKYFDMEPFGQWRDFKGLSFAHKAGKIDIWETLKSNSLRTLWHDIKQLDVSGYDLILTDFEPVVAWAGRQQKKTVIGMGHQFAFHHEIPKKGDSWATNALMRYFAKADLGVGLHWHHFGCPILPPIADIPSGDTPVIPNKVLVYLGFERPEDVRNMLAPIEGYQFYYYGEFDQPSTEGNIQFRPLSREGFQRDLADANGVICNAGFELASEALELGKKLLVKPLYGQMEQLSNARALELLGIGSVMDKLSSDAVNHWLQHQPNVKIHYPDVPSAVIAWLAQGRFDQQSLFELSLDLWQQVHTDDVANFVKLGQLETAKP